MFFGGNDNDKNPAKTAERRNHLQPHPDTKTHRRTRAAESSGSLDSWSADDDSSDKPGAVPVPGVSRASNDVTSGIDNFMTYFQRTVWGQEDSGKAAVLTAKPVNEDSHLDDIDEAEKIKIHEKAKRDVQLRIVSNAVEAEATNVVEEEARRRRRETTKLCLLAGLILLVLGAGVAGLTIALSSKPSSQETGTPTLAPTNSPTAKPPIFTSNPIVDVDNTVCEGAFDIATTIGKGFFGNISSLATVAPVDTCEVIFRNGVGVWYRISGDGSLYSASTCNSTSFDTQISIFQGACGKLQCVAGNDQTRFCGNGDQSMVGFATQPGVEYYIYVHARRQSRNLFQMLVEKLDFNDECQAATPLDFVNSNLIPRRFGSTRGASIDDVECQGVVPNAPGVWYTVVGLGVFFGNGEYLTIDFESSGTGFSPRVMVFEGDDCGSLTSCVSKTGREWQSEGGKTFYILVYGNEESSEGDYQFSIERTEFRGTGSPTFPPVLQIQDCRTPFTLLPGEMQLSSTRNQIREGAFFSCGNLVFSTAAAVWFIVIGTGGALTVSTCSSTFGFDSQISVFRGTCEALECIDGNDQACGDSSSVSWFSELDELYHIAVHGFATRAGLFSITLDETEILGSGTCDMAIEILPDTGISILGQPADNTSFENQFSSCEVSPADGPGVWYSLWGNGKSITASTCLTSEDVSTRITVFGGDCSNLDCVSVVDAACGTQHHSVEWIAESETEYYIFVQVQSSTVDDIGQFVLYTEATTPNRWCQNAIGPLGPDASSPTFGSTRSAALVSLETASRQLEDDSVADRRGVWYSFLGTGELIRASTCSEYTEFQTSLTVYEGSSCEMLVLVVNQPNDEEICDKEFGSNKVWSSIEGELYYLFVEGVNLDAFGNFALSIVTVT